MRKESRKMTVASKSVRAGLVFLNNCVFENGANQIVSLLLGTHIVSKYERDKLTEDLKSATRTIIFTLLLDPAYAKGEGEEESGNEVENKVVTLAQKLNDLSWGVSRLCMAIEQVLDHDVKGL